MAFDEESPAFLSAIADVARERGASRLRAPLVTAPRNEPVRRFLVEAGFAEGASSTWTLPVAAASEWPTHVSRA